MNLSTVADEHTARTCRAAAVQRAEHLAILGVRTVLELCVGPSLAELEIAYATHGIRVTGNDIDPRWVTAHPRGRWVLGDALTVDLAYHDAIVFAPPLSRGCTGRRDDALRADEVTPRYQDFLTAVRHRLSLLPARHVSVVVLVLPGRALASRRDRAATHAVIRAAELWEWKVEIVPLRDARGRVVKYHDAYLTRV